MSISKSIPSCPGVYLHKDERGDIIYVGKAKNLKKRVSSYIPKKDHGPKTALLVKNIASTDFIVTNNELEALLLENRLIKKHKPKFNIELKDAVRYCYIQVTREKFPRVFMTRKTNKRDRFFGPYTGSVAHVAKIMRDLFKLRSCGPIMPKRTCIYYDLGLCSAPCEDKVSQQEYTKSVEEAVHLIRHGDPEVKRKYYDAMKEASQKQDFERALELRKRIELLDRLTQRQIVDVLGRRDQDAIGIATVSDRSHITVLKSKRGVIQSKDDFTFLRSDELLNEFLKAYYSTRPAPHEILVNLPFDPSIEQYLRDVWNRGISITRVTRGDKKDLVLLAQKNAYAAFNLDDPVLIAMKEALRLDTMPHVIDCFDISNIGEVTIYFMRDNDDDPIPNSSEVAEVKAAIDGIKPGNTDTLDVHVYAPTPETTDFVFSVISPDTASMRVAIENSLKEFYAQRTEVAVDIVEEAYNAAIFNTYDLVTGAELESFTLTSPSADIVIAAGKIGKLGNVTF